MILAIRALTVISDERAAMKIPTLKRARRMMSKNISIRPDQENWLMAQAVSNKSNFSEAARAAIDLAMESEKEEE
jgi:hypothetical protein